MAEDELRGSTPVMTAKDLLLELWNDMKVVRPIAENLEQADIITRVERLEQRERDEDTTRAARGQMVNWTNKTLGIVVVLCTIFLSILTIVSQIMEKFPG